MGRVTNRYYGFCPLLEDFHIPNVVGCTQRRQLIVGDNITIPAGPANTKAYTWSTFTGGLIETIDHSQIFAQKLNAAPTNRTRIASKSTSGFTLVGDGGLSDVTYSVIAFLTLPTNPHRTPKWAKDYCPGCKNMDFWAIPGSIFKDIGMFQFRCATGGGGTLAVSWENVTVINPGDAGDWNIADCGAAGSLRSPAVHVMANTDYQIIIFPSSTAPAAAPYPSSITRDGFTLNGDASEIFNVLILGQITN